MDSNDNSNNDSPNKSGMTIIIEEDLRKPENRSSVKIIKPNNNESISNEDDLQNLKNNETDPLNSILVNFLKDILNSSIEETNVELLNNFKLEKIEQYNLEDIKKENIKKEDSDDNDKNNNEKNDNNIKNYEKEEINTPNDTINNTVNYYSIVEDIDSLDKWLSSNIDENKNYKSNDDGYNSDSIDLASGNGKILSLDWWLKVNKEHRVPLKYTEKALFLTSKNGHIKCLEWWINSKLELKYDNNCIDYASNTGKINVLEWWYQNYKNGNVKFEYTCSSTDGTKLVESRLLEVVKWWKKCIDNDKEIIFKYTKKFINFIQNYKYSSVQKFLIDNKMVNLQDFFVKRHINNVPNNNNNIFGIFDLIGKDNTKNKPSYSKEISNFPKDIQDHIKEKESELNNNIMINGKTKEYIDNLIKIPFGTYRNEKIFTFMHDLVKK